MHEYVAGNKVKAQLFQMMIHTLFSSSFRMILQFVKSLGLFFLFFFGGAGVGVLFPDNLLYLQRTLHWVFAHKTHYSYVLWFKEQQLITAIVFGLLLSVFFSCALPISVSVLIKKC